MIVEVEKNSYEESVEDWIGDEKETSKTDSPLYSFSRPISQLPRLLSGIILLTASTAVVSHSPGCTAEVGYGGSCQGSPLG